MRRLPLLALGLVIAAYFAPALAGRTLSVVPGYQNGVYPWAAWPNGMPFFPQSDQAEVYLPWHALISRSLRAGELPLWNPYSFGGQPLFSNAQSATVGVLRWFTLLWADPHTAHEIHGILVVSLAAFLHYRLILSLRCDAWAAAFGALCWAMSSCSLGWLHLDPIVPVFVFTPLVAWLTGVALARRSWASFSVAAFAVAAALTGGHLLLLASSAVAGACFAGMIAVVEDHGGARQRAAAAARCLAVLAVGALVAWPVLWPTAVTLEASARGPLPRLEALAANPVPLSDLVSFFRPPADIDERALYRLAYVGLTPLVLACIGLMKGHSARLPALGLVCGALSLVYGTPVLDLVYRLVPDYTLFRPLGRLYFVTTFGISILAALGLANVRERLAGRSLRRVAAAVGGLAMAVTGLELVVVGRGLNPDCPPRRAEDLFPATPLTLELQAAAGGAASGWMRIAPLSGQHANGSSIPVLVASVPVVFALDSLGGFDSVVPRTVVQVLRHVEGVPLPEALERVPSAAYRPWFTLAATRIGLLPRLGVTHVVVPPGTGDDPVWQRRIDASGVPMQHLYRGEDGEIYRLTEGGGPFIVCRAAKATTSDEALAEFLQPEFDHRAEVILEDTAPVASRGCRPRRARLTSRSANQVEVDVDAGGGWLIVPQNWDAGWSASIDGTTVSVLRANGLHQAVRLGASTRRVRLDYAPSGLRTGVYTALATCAALACGALHAHLNRS